MPHSEGHDTGLLDVRDELATTSRLVTALWLAAQASHLPQADRRALSELAGVCRDRLEGCLAAFDKLIKPINPPSAPLVPTPTGKCGPLPTGSAMRSSSQYPFGSRLGPAVTLPRPLPRPPRSFPVATPAVVPAAQPSKIIDWTAVAWAASECVFCGFFGLAELGSTTGLSALLLPSAAVALVVLLQKVAGVVFDPNRGTVWFYSFWLPQEVALADIRDANCEFAMTLSPSCIAFAICAGNSKQHRGRELARQRTYSVNLSGSFGSRQVRFYGKRWRDQFLSVLRDAAPGCRITRWR